MCVIQGGLASSSLPDGDDSVADGIAQIGNSQDKSQVVTSHMEGRAKRASHPRASQHLHTPADAHWLPPWQRQREGVKGN